MFHDKPALLSSNIYLKLFKRGVLDKVRRTQDSLNNYLAYGYREEYLHSAKTTLEAALETIREIENENSKI